MKRRNHIVITSDGWVYVLMPDKEIGLGDIGVDVVISDLRQGRNKNISASAELMKEMENKGMSITAIAKELRISRPTVYKLLK